MPFEKGKSGNPKGKRKGTPNKTTQEIRDLLESNKHKLVERAIKLVLTPALANTNTAILSKLLDKLIPTLQHTQFDGTMEHKTIKEMSDAELYKIANSSSKGTNRTETIPN